MGDYHRRFNRPVEGKKFAVETDADLARKLRVDKSTVSSWRRRDGLPARFQKILEVGLSAQSVQAPPLEWGERREKGILARPNFVIAAYTQTS